MYGGSISRDLTTLTIAASASTGFKTPKTSGQLPPDFRIESTEVHIEGTLTGTTTTFRIASETELWALLNLVSTVLITTPTTGDLVQSQGLGDLAETIYRATGDLPTSNLPNIGQTVDVDSANTKNIRMCVRIPHALRRYSIEAMGAPFVAHFDSDGFVFTLTTPLTVSLGGVTYTLAGTIRIRLRGRVATPTHGSFIQWFKESKTEREYPIPAGLYPLLYQDTDVGTTIAAAANRDLRFMVDGVNAWLPSDYNVIAQIIDYLDGFSYPQAVAVDSAGGNAAGAVMTAFWDRAFVPLCYWAEWQSPSRITQAANAIQVKFGDSYTASHVIKGMRMLPAANFPSAPAGYALGDQTPISDPAFALVQPRFLVAK